MVINRDMREATLITLGGVDEYGQDGTEELETSTINLTFGLYKHTQVEDIRFQDVEYTGLTFDDVRDDQIIVLDDVRYRVQFVNTFGRMHQVFLIKE